MTSPKKSEAPLSERRPSEQEAVLRQYDTAMAEVLLRREQAPPDLAYLDHEREGSLQMRSYNYSPAMINAIGVHNGRVKKGSSNLGCHTDGGPPWASVPKALEPPIVSVVGADYVKREEMKELPEDLDGGGTSDLLRKVQRDREMSERRRETSRRLVEQLREEEKAHEAALAQQAEEEKAKLGQLRETVKCFSHKGLERRAISAPLPGDSDDDDQEYVKQRRMAVARQERLVGGTMGLRLPVPRKRAASADPAAAGEEEDEGPSSVVDVDVVSDGRAPQRPSAFWYARDRQRFKHRTLEEQRLAEAQSALLQNGWAQSTDLGGAPKRVGQQDVLRGLPPDQREAIEREADEFIAAKATRDSTARLRYNTMIARARPSELRGTVPVTTSPFPHEEAAPLAEQVQEASRTAVDVGEAAKAQDDSHKQGRVYVRPFMFERPPPFKPLPVYRPELPAARVPQEMQKMEMPLSSDELQRKSRAGVAPPWGRETDDDAKWARIHVNKKTKVVEVKPLTKKELTGEMRLVRDKGLQRKPRAKVAETMTPAQREFVRSIPSTGPLAAQAMRPARDLPRGSLS